MSTAEIRFREVEAFLDQQLSGLDMTTDFPGVLMRDYCARTYHYKNQELMWSYQFVLDTHIDVEVERISVWLTYMEPLAEESVLEVLVRSELFQQGQVSRVDRKHKCQLPIAKIEDGALSQFWRMDL